MRLALGAPISICSGVGRQPASELIAWRSNMFRSRRPGAVVTRIAVPLNEVSDYFQLDKLLPFEIRN